MLVNKTKTGLHFGLQRIIELIAAFLFLVTDYLFFLHIYKIICMHSRKLNITLAYVYVQER